MITTAKVLGIFLGNLLTIKLIKEAITMEIKMTKTRSRKKYKATSKSATKATLKILEKLIFTFGFLFSILFRLYHSLRIFSIGLLSLKGPTRERFSVSF